jgi:hypothetical protein
MFGRDLPSQSRRRMLYSGAVALLTAGSLPATVVPGCPGAAAPAPQRPAAAIPLTFRELFVPSSQELEPSPRLLALNGKRVSIAGFMARQERPPKGAFYLCPCRTFCDEGSAGVGDLTPDAVLVKVRGAKDREIAFIPHPIQVSGVLEVGYRQEAGQVSWIRLTLDQECPGKERQKAASLRSEGKRQKTGAPKAWGRAPGGRRQK